MDRVSKTMDSEENQLSAIDRQLAELDIGHQDAADETKGVQNVRVMVRCRPRLTSGSQVANRERQTNSQQASPLVQVDEDSCSVRVQGRIFHYDAVFGPQSDNEQVYMRSARKLVEFAFRGYNCTVFLYGQTGTGKTYTHSSLASSAFAHLFSLIRDSNSLTRFLIRASYYELYNEDIRDLLSNSTKPLELRESKARGVYVKDLTCYLVNNIGELERLKRLGDKKRATAATKMNEQSSRSHSILSLTIEMVRRGQQGALSADKTQVESTATVRVGRLHLIDLAGSERQSKSGSSGTRLKEASQINLSLTCLSLVIRALTDPAGSHVPYRNSKLTRLLSSSLGGNSMTLLIACVSPVESSLDETLNTLRFASRTKKIKNAPKINEDAKDALLRKYRHQIEELRRELEQKSNSTLSEDEQIEALIKAAQSNQRKQLVQGTSSSSDELLRQLKLLKGKIMVGGENLLEKAEIHERLLEAGRQELEEKRQREEKLKEELEKKRLAISQMTQVKGSLASRVSNLDEKLRRALLLYRATKEESRDQESEHLQLRENMLQSIRSTSREIKYADCIIEDFIPKEYLELINTYAQYDDESDEWQIKYIALSGNNIAQTKRLTENQTGALISEQDDNNQPGSSACRASRADPYVRLKDLSA